MNCDPNALAQAARCFSCLPAYILEGIKSYLLCQWENAGPAPPGSNIGYTMISSFGWESGTLANSTTYFWGGDLYNSTQFQMSGGSAYNNSRIQVPFAGTIKRFYLKLKLATPGTGETVSHFIRINNATDVAQIDLAYTAAEVHGTNSTVSQAVSRNDFICIKLVTPAWISSPIGRRLWACVYIE